MSVTFIMPNGERVPVPMDVVAQGNKAQQSFYDLQLERIEMDDAPATRKRS